MTDSKCHPRDKSEKAKGFYWAIGLNRTMLKSMGLWPDVVTSKKELTVPIMAACLFSGITVPQTYALTEVRENLPLVIENIITNGTATVGAVKILLMWKGRRVIDSLVSQMKDDWSEASEFADEMRMIKLQANRARLLTITSCCATAFALIGFLMMPILRLSPRLINNITDIHPSRHLVFQTYYPYDVYRSPTYELTRFHQIIAGCVVGISYTVPENFFATVVLHACAQCQIIERHFRRLANCDYATCRSRFYFVARLRRIVDRHVRLISFVDNVEITFNYLILAHMLNCTVVIGCIGFALLQTLADDNDSSKISRLGSFLMASLDLALYSLFYCGAGELLTLTSFRLLNATYQANLQSLPKNYARDFIMLMKRSQYPLQLTAGKFFNLSLNSYLQLMKKAFGYISMLITVNQ